MPANVVEIILRGRDQASKTIDKNIKGMTGLKRIAVNVSKAMVVGLAAAAASALVLAQNVAKTGDELHKMSERTGVSVEALSELRHAAELSGADVLKLQDGLKDLSKNMAEASRGAIAQSDAFDRIGVSVTNADGSLKSVEEILPEVADGLNGLTSDAERNATAMAIMGESGFALQPLLKAGSEGIREMREEAQKLGLTWSQTAAEDAAAYVDAQTRIKASLDGLKNILGQAIIPLFTEVADKISDWVAANQPLIRQISDIISLLSKETKDLVRLFDIGVERVKVEEKLAENLEKQVGKRNESMRLVRQQIQLEGELVGLAAEEEAIYGRLNEQRETQNEQIEETIELVAELPEFADEFADAMLRSHGKVVASFETDFIGPYKAEMEGLTEFSISTADRIALSYSETMKSAASIISTSMADSIATFVVTGKAGMDVFFEHTKRLLTKLALHKLFNLLANISGGGAGSIFGKIAGFFGASGGLIPETGFAGDAFPTFMQRRELLMPPQVADAFMQVMELARQPFPTQSPQPNEMFAFAERSTSNRPDTILLDGRQLASAAGQITLARIVQPGLDEFARSREGSRES